MISVIIPVLNESATIASVVSFVWQSPFVNEVIVVDDGSTDETVALARSAGARVLTSTMLGKGASMEDGVWAARGEILVFLDGDLSQLDEGLIERLIQPIRNEGADFVKARFSRTSGRVTTLTAKPLLATFFPDLAHFDQPLGGIIAARRSFLRHLRFENDYGVDVGLLIDAAMSGGRVVEVDVGHVHHESQPLEALANMARHVVRVILNRAAHYNRLHLSQVREVEEIERHLQAEFPLVMSKIDQAQRLALFDVDGVLLRDRFVVRLAQRLNKLVELNDYLDHPTLDADERTRKIAALFAGVPREEFEEIARRMPLMPGAVETIIALRKAGYRVGILSNGYRIVSEIIRRRVFADFSIAHVMQFRDGVATGQIKLSPIMQHPEGCSHHVHCRFNAMLRLVERLDLSLDQILAVGDGEHNLCMLQSAGLSVAFEPKSFAVEQAAQYVIEGDLRGVLDVLEDEFSPKVA